jgi:chemotaxis protein MotB
MYGISSVNEGKFKVFSYSLSEAFNGGVQSAGTVAQLTQEDLFLRSVADRRNARQAEAQRKRDEFVKKVTSDLNRVMGALIKSQQVSVSQTSRGIELEINASVLFETGQAEIQSAAIGVLAEVAKLLAGDDHSIEVNGHTDDIPIHTAQFPSNWELSSARASSVVRLFIEQGVSSRRLTAVGLADNFPLVPNITPEARAKNRRIAISILAPQAERTGAHPAQ